MAAASEGRSTWQSYPPQVRGAIYLLSALAAAATYSLAHQFMASLFGVALVFIFAAVIALLLAPLVDRVEAFWVFRGRRGAAVLATFVVSVLLTAGLGLLLVPLLASQLGALGLQLPQALAGAQAMLDQVQGALYGFGLDVDLKVPKQPRPAGTGTAVAVLGTAVHCRHRRASRRCDFALSVGARA